MTDYPPTGAVGWADDLQDYIAENIGESGAGSPEGVLNLPLGTVYRQTDIGAIWVKEGGVGTAFGWVVK